MYETRNVDNPLTIPLDCGERLSECDEYRNPNNSVFVLMT